MLPFYDLSIMLKRNSMHQLKISIIIPTFNRANYLKHAIESALSQDYEEIEVIVSDNASTDETPEIVKKYFKDKRFNYFRNQQNIGMVANWRKALYEYANGEFFLILSDDDYFTNDQYLSKAANLIKNHENIVMVYADGYIHYENVNKTFKFNLPFKKNIENGKKIIFTPKKITQQYHFLLSNVLFNRKLALELNSFSNNYNLACDAELFFKTCLFGKVGIITDFVSIYNHHSANLVNKVTRNYSLLLNSLDHVFEPYYLARRLNVINDMELEYWENNIIVPYLVFVLLSTLFYHQEKYNETLELLRNMNYKLLYKAQNSSILKLFLVLSKFNIHLSTYNFLRQTKHFLKLRLFYYLPST